jgi:hypothetical protein
LITLLRNNGGFSGVCCGQPFDLGSFWHAHLSSAQIFLLWDMGNE